MDIREAQEKLENLDTDMRTNNTFDWKLDQLSRFFYSDLDKVIDAIGEAIDQIEFLEEERDSLQKQLDEMEG